MAVTAVTLMHFTRYQLTVCSHGFSALAELLVRHKDIKDRHVSIIVTSALCIVCGVDASINQSSKLYFPNNDEQLLQYNKCYSTWKATRKALRSLKLVAWTKSNTNKIIIHQKNIWYLRFLSFQISITDLFYFNFPKVLYSICFCVVFLGTVFTYFLPSANITVIMFSVC